MASYLNDLWRTEKARRKERERQGKAGRRYGVFVWTEANRYPEENAVRIFKRESAAKKLAEANYVLNYVVRSL